MRCWPASSGITQPIRPASGQRPGYRQNYFEVGWAQELRPRVSLELNAYLHTGHNSFENHEISISRIFVPINFHTVRSEGAELVLNLRQLERLGISGLLQYALAKTYFYGPITGASQETNRWSLASASCPPLTRPTPARRRFSITIAGADSGRAAPCGAIIEGGARLPQHFTSDLVTGINLWMAEPGRLDLEFDITNVSNSLYQIAKESDEIPIQYAPSRTVGGSLKFHF
jgi:hypothetical protein